MAHRHQRADAHTITRSRAFAKLIDALTVCFHGLMSVKSGNLRHAVLWGVIWSAPAALSRRAQNNRRWTGVSCCLARESNRRLVGPKTANGKSSSIRRNSEEPPA